MTDRWQESKINKSFSSWSTLLQEVPQEFVLGPILFNIYLNDFFYFLFFDICNFEDDTTPYVCNKSLAFVRAKLEEHSNIAMKWFKNKNMKMNSGKFHFFYLWIQNLNIYGLKLVMIEHENVEQLNS